MHFCLLACECWWQNTSRPCEIRLRHLSPSRCRKIHGSICSMHSCTRPAAEEDKCDLRGPCQAAGPRFPPVFTCPAPTPPETPPDKQDTAAAKSQIKLERAEPKRLAAARLSAPTPTCMADMRFSNSATCQALPSFELLGLKAAEHFITMVNNSLLLVLRRTVDGMHVPLTACAAAASTTCAPSCLSPRLGAAAREAAPRVRFHACSAITVTAQ